MLQLNFPSYSFNVKSANDKRMIFDSCRKKYVPLTPEEWVRQNMVQFLIQEKNFPKSWIANEVTVELNQMRKRCDTVVFDKNSQPILIIEYKAPNVKITQETFDQIASYNFKLKVNYLIVSNGISHYCCKINYEEQKYIFFQEIPSFDSL